MLAAWELGVGSCPATVYDHELARELLGYPADRHCEFLVRRRREMQRERGPLHGHIQPAIGSEPGQQDVGKAQFRGSTSRGHVSHDTGPISSFPSLLSRASHARQARQQIGRAHV